MELAILLGGVRASGRVDVITSRNRGERGARNLDCPSINTDKPGGADALFGALSRDHDGGLLDDLGGFLGGGQTTGGDRILGHVLGGKRQAVETGLSRSSGLDMATIGKLLPLLAPIVMGFLGKAQKQQGLDAQGLSSLLTGERQTAERRAPDAMGVLSNLLDTDNDGQVVDDVVKIGSSLLGGLFGK